MREPLHPGHDRDRARIQNIPDGLLLRQDQPPFGGSRIDRHHQHHKITGGKQVGDQRLFIGIAVGELRDALLERMDIRPIRRADIYFVLRSLRACSEQVGFVVRDDIRNLPLRKQADQLAVGRLQSNGAIHYQHRNIRPAKHAQCAPDALLPQTARIIHAGRVDDHDRPRGQQFHRFLHRVGCGALDR